MSKTLKLMWQFKWVSVATLSIELLILLPVYFMLYRFGESALTVNLAVTPIGSSEHISLLLDAIINHRGFVSGIVIFILLVPILFGFKLALAAGCVNSMQSGQWRFSQWLSDAGKNIIGSLGLFIRWLFIPVILCALAVLLVKFINVGGKTLLLATVAAIWLLSFSWFSYALNFTVRKEKKALIRGFKVLCDNLHRVVLTLLIFASGAAMIKYASWLYFKSNSAIETGLVSATVGALILGLVTRLLVLFWHSSHVLGWKKSQMP